MVIKYLRILCTVKKMLLPKLLRCRCLYCSTKFPTFDCSILGSFEYHLVIFSCSEGEMTNENILFLVRKSKTQHMNNCMCYFYMSTSLLKMCIKLILKVANTWGDEATLQCTTNWQYENILSNDTRFQDQKVRG